MHSSCAKSMKALVLRSPQNLQFMKVPRPAAGPGQVIVKVHECGICGSDVRYFYGENPWAKQTLGREIPNPPNIIFGHEFVGTVVEAHDVIDQSLIGKRVGVNTFITCGRCTYCRRGQENLCDHTTHLGHGQGWGQMDFYPGGMAEFCPAFANQCYELPPQVTDRQATFFDPLIASLHAVDVGRPAILDKVVVLGAGPIGLLIAQLVKIYGASQTFVTDLAEKNIQVARAVGVDHAINISDPGQNLHELVMAETNREGVNLIFNTIGTEESIVDSLKLLRKGGTLVLLATKDSEIRFPSLLLTGERTIRTSCNAMYSDFPRVIELVAKGMVKVDPLVTHNFALVDGLKAFEVACNKAGSGAIKVIIECQKI